MSNSKFILPQVILKRKGTFNEVLIKLKSIEFTHPDITVGDLADAINNADFARQAAEALIAKGECPINLPSIHCPSCFANPTHHKCEYNNIKAVK